MKTFEYGCKDCIFYQPAWDEKEKKDREKGGCRFHPPTPIVTNEGKLLGLFAPVHEKAWCGQFTLLKPDKDSVGANPIVPSGAAMVGES